MKEHKELENLVGKLFETDKADSPSTGFTYKVMAQIEALQNSKFKYKPLLPKWVFVSIAFGISIFTWYVLKMNDSETLEFNYLPEMDTNALFASWFEQLNLSSSLGYSLVTIGIMLCIQAVLFTKRFNKRFA